MFILETRGTFFFMPKTMVVASYFIVLKIGSISHSAVLFSVFLCVP